MIELDVESTFGKTSRFKHYLREILPSTDPAITELTARAIGKLALVSGNYTSEYVDHEVKRAFDWLVVVDRNSTEDRRYAALCVLKELASSCPTFFFQHVQQFFDNVFVAVFDSHAYVREKAAEAIRSAIVVTAQRETRDFEKPPWYRQCYLQVEKELQPKASGKEERVHGSLLVLCELYRCSNVDAERTRLEAEELYANLLETGASGRFP